MDDRYFYEQDGLWGADHIADAASQDRRLTDTQALLPTVSTLLDVGAGDGRFAAYVRQQVSDPPWILAAERSATALGFVEGPRILASGEDLPVRDRAVEAVTVLEVLEHLPVTSFEQVRREVARVARRWIVVTVPNRERVARLHVTCQACRCRYSPIRHLRSFHPETMGDLFSGFDLVDVRDVGLPAYSYPRMLRVALERAGLLARPGAPVCPQCGAEYRRSPRLTAEPSTTPDHTGLAQRGYRLARRLTPRARHSYLLGALYERRSDSGERDDGR